MHDVTEDLERIGKQGGHFYLPPKLCYCTKRVTFNKPFVLIGDDWRFNRLMLHDSLDIKASGCVAQISVLKASSTAMPRIRLYDNHETEIHDVKFIDVPARVYSCWDWKITECQFVDHADIALAIRGTPERQSNCGKIQDCRFENNSAVNLSILEYSRKINIIDTKFHGRLDGIVRTHVALDKCRCISVRGCNLTMSDGIGLHAVNVLNLSVLHNTFDALGTAGLFESVRGLTESQNQFSIDKPNKEGFVLRNTIE